MIDTRRYEPVFCPCCGQTIENLDNAVICGTCRKLHHLECWEGNRGCCTLGCPAAPQQAAAPPPFASASPDAPYHTTHSPTPPSYQPWFPPSGPVSGAPSPHGGLHEFARYGSWLWVISLLVLVVMLSTALSLPIIVALALHTGDPAAVLTNPFVLFVIIALEDAAFVGVVYFLLVRRKITSWRDMGLRGAPTLRSLGLGGLWGTLFVIASSAVELLMRLFGVEQTQAAQFPLGQGGIAGTVAIWVAGIILAPITEEIFFRGFIFRAMALRKGYVKGVVYSSLVFGLVHLNLEAFLPISIGAAILAVGYKRSGDLWVPIIAHALNNFVAFLLLTFTAG